MNHLQAAALRILESTPRERIRKHEKPVIDRREKGGREEGDVPVSAARRARIAHLVNERNPATGERWTERQIAVLLGISRVAVQKHMRALKANGFSRIPLSEGERGREVSPPVAETAPAVKQVRDILARPEMVWSPVCRKAVADQSEAGGLTDSDALLVTGIIDFSSNANSRRA